MINGKTYSYYGLTLLKVEGGLDMPSRIGNIYYDWGDKYEALLHGDDIFFKKRNIIIHALSDLAKDSVEKLKELPISFLISTLYGDFTVKLQSITELKQYLGGKSRLKLTFQEVKASFTATLPIKTNDRSYSIDNYSFKKDLGIYVHKVVQEDNIPNALASSKTVFKEDKDILKKYPFGKIKMICYHKKQNIKQNIEALKKILSQSGERELRFEKRAFKVFFSNGFQLRQKGNLYNFTLLFNVLYELDNFVVKGFVQDGFIDGF